MDAAPKIRMATTEDARGVVAIYAPIVLDTAISFEYEPPSVEEMSERIVSTLAQLRGWWPRTTV